MIIIVIIIAICMIIYNMYNVYICIIYVCIVYYTCKKISSNAIKSHHPQQNKWDSHQAIQVCKGWQESSSPRQCSPCPPGCCQPAFVFLKYALKLRHKLRMDFIHLVKICRTKWSRSAIFMWIWKRDLGKFLCWIACCWIWWNMFCVFFCIPHLSTRWTLKMRRWISFAFLSNKCTVAINRVSSIFSVAFESLQFDEVISISWVKTFWYPSK